LGAFVRHVEDEIAELEKATGPSVAASTEPDPNEELADLREVLRLGRHLLEGRQVTL
jgi:hypothetical protein